MPETVCKGCGGVMDFSGIDPFTVCECSDCGTEVVIPYELDYLKLERPLETKCFFDIYEGFDQSHNLDSVILILKKDIPDYATFLGMAKEDAIALTTLKHPNICPIINCGEVQGYFFVSYPKMDGYTLSEYAPDSQGLLDVQSVISVLQAAALGFAVAHHKEFVHHDICDQTVHIDARGNVRLKNFFIGRFNYNCLQHSQDLAYDVSPYYISPEKAESKVEDKRGDVFSYGVLCYYMLTGRYPFAGKTDVETIFSRVRRKKADTTEIFSADSKRMLTPETVEYVKPPMPHELRSEVPEEISLLVMDMLSSHPVQRPKFTEILASINLFMAKQEKQKVVHSAQKEMVSTKTRAIPVMKNLYSPDDGKKGKKWIFFK